MANEVVFHIGNNANHLAQAKLWVDRAYFEVQGSRIFRETQATATVATVIGTVDYALATDFYAILDVKNTTRVKRMTQRSILGFDKLPAATSTAPTDYAIFGTRLYVYPTPDAIYTLTYRYRKNLAALADGDNHLLSSPWTQVIVMRAAAMGFDYLNEIERAQAARVAARSAAAMISDPLTEDLIDRNEPTSVVGLVGQ